MQDCEMAETVLVISLLGSGIMSTIWNENG